jgi:hypothetical protein
MSTRKTRTERARELRDFIILEHAGRCEVCGSQQQLEFHLKVSDGGRHHGMSFTDRTAFYFHQHNVGNVQLLCSKHHRQLTTAESRAQRLRRASCLIS